MIHTIIFDMGGTLAGGPDIFRVLADAIEKEHGISVDDELRKEFTKVYTGAKFYDVKTMFELITKNVLEVHGIRRSPIRPSHLYRTTFRKDGTLFDESLDVLGYLKAKGVKLVMLSDADADVLMPQLRMFDIARFFDDILISSDLGCYKTSPRMADIMRSKIHAPFKDILFVGDSSFDVLTGQGMGVRTVFIDRTGKSGPGDFTIRTLTELKSLIEQEERT